MKLAIALICTAALAVTACGDDSALLEASIGDDSSSDSLSGSAGARTADIDPCGLLTDAEITSVFGQSLTPDESEPAGPFTGCSWGTGTVLVSLATSDVVILAPGEENCPSAGIGDESYNCEGRVKFLANGIHVTVSTIDPFPDEDQLLTVANTVLSKLP